MSIVYTGKLDERIFNKQIPETINNLIKKDNKVVWLDADLMACSGVKAIAKNNKNIINVGIAEGNMAGIAAGLSASGMKPYIHSFAPFASRRCFDQLFMSCGYAKNDITVVGTDPGVTAAFNGGTHMPFEDVALFRSIPNAIICDCTDIPMLNSFLRQAKDLKGVKYIRTPRKTSYQVFSDDTDFQIGKGIVVREGSDLLIVASGIMVHEALQAANELSKSNIEACIIDPFTIKPFDCELVREYANKCKNVLVAENHNKIGGLVSAVQDALIGMPINFGYVAIEDRYGQVGPLDFLQKEYGLTSAHIVERTKEIIK